MFYDKQPKDKQEAYKNMLSIVGSLSKLFSDSVSPYLYYRAHENIFAKQIMPGAMIPQMPMT